MVDIPMGLIGGSWEALPETALATTGMEVATVGEAALATGLEVGGTVGAAGGFEIPVWGWIATGVAVAGGVGYGIYKHYKNQGEADTAARKQGFKSSAEVLDAAKAGFKNARELRFVDEQIKKAGLGNDLADYAQKHGHASLEDFMKTAASGSATNGHLFAQSWGYKSAAEMGAAQQQQTISEGGNNQQETANSDGKPKPVQHTVKPVSQDEVLRLQKALGLDEAHQTGQWDKDTNDAVARLVVRAQLTDAYAQAGGTVEGKYGPKTEAGLKSLAAEGKVSEEAANAVMSIGAARLHQVYRPPHDVDAVVHQVNFADSVSAPIHVEPVKRAPITLEAPPSTPIDLNTQAYDLPVSLPTASYRAGNYRMTLGTNLANDGTGHLPQAHEGNEKIRDWDVKDRSGKITAHATVVEANEGGKHVVDTSVTSEEGTRTTHSINGKMQWSIVNLKETDGSMVVASHQERDVKGKLVEQVTTANAGMKSAASLRAGM